MMQMIISALIAEKNYKNLNNVRRSGMKKLIVMLACCAAVAAAIYGIMVGLSLLEDKKKELLSLKGE